jgi:hypothetical protein
MSDDEDCPFDDDGSPAFGAMGLTAAFMNMGMCKDCAMRLAPLICAGAMIDDKDGPCSDKCADALYQWAHPFSSFGRDGTPRRSYSDPEKQLAKILRAPERMQ